MKTLLSFLLLGLLAPSARATEPDDQLPTPPDGKSLKLIWQDEFDGNRLDETKWEARPDGKRKGGWWSRKAITLDGEGHLVIATFMDGDKPTDGCIWTKGKFEHAFGYYVARVKFQKEPGHSSAFWMNSDGIRKVGDGGRDGTELDIMEKPWLDDRVQYTFHWDGYGKDHKQSGSRYECKGLNKGFHTIGLEWTPTEYVFYVDGKVARRTRDAVSHRAEYMILSLEVGKWAGDIRKAKLPYAVSVDYVRVYKKKPQDKIPPPTDA